MDFSEPTDHRGKIKEREKLNNHLDIAIKFNKLWNMRVIVISIEVNTLEKFPKDLKEWRKCKTEEESSWLVGWMFMAYQPL